jgi:L-rhamnose isomerase
MSTSETLTSVETTAIKTRDWHSVDWRKELPFTSYRMEPEEFKAWVAGRKEAGMKIDVETCEIMCREFKADDYGVRTPDSDGWVYEGDLPEAAVKALHVRIRRERFYGLPAPF